MLECSTLAQISNPGIEFSPEGYAENRTRGHGRVLRVG
jgi:hypothetical protein